MQVTALPLLDDAEIVPLPGGAVLIPVDQARLVAEEALVRNGLISDRVYRLNRALTGSLLTTWNDATLGLANDLAHSSEDSALVSRLTQLTEVRAIDHASEYADLRELRDSLMPISDRLASFAGAEVRSIIYSKTVLKGLDLVGASPLPDMETGVRETADLYASLPEVDTHDSVLWNAVKADFYAGMENFNDQAVLISPESDVNRDPILRARYRKLKAWGYILLPALQIPLFYWHSIRNLAFQVEEVMSFLKEMDHPLARGTEDAEIIANISRFPLAPSLHKAVRAVGARSSTKTLFGPAEVICVPHWFTKCLRQHMGAEASSATTKYDPFVAWRDAVRAFFAADGPYESLTRTLGRATGDTTEARTAVDNAGSTLGWTSPEGGALLPENVADGLCDLQTVRTDGLYLDASFTTYDGMRRALLTHHYIRSASRKVVDNLEDVTGWQPRALIVSLKHDFKPRMISPTHDPLTVLLLSSGAEIEPGMESVDVSLEGLTLLLRLHNTDHLKSEVARDPDSWSHLVTFDPSTGAVACREGGVAYVRTEWSMRLPLSFLLDPGAHRVSHYYRFFQGRFQMAGAKWSGRPLEWEPRFYYKVGGTANLPYLTIGPLE